VQEPRILCCIPEKEKRGKTDNRVALKEILRQNVRDPAGARAPALWRRLQGELSPPRRWSSVRDRPGATITVSGQNATGQNATGQNATNSGTFFLKFSSKAVSVCCYVHFI